MYELLILSVIALFLFHIFFSLSLGYIWEISKIFISFFFFQLSTVSWLNRPLFFLIFNKYQPKYESSQRRGSLQSLGHTPSSRFRKDWPVWVRRCTQPEKQHDHSAGEAAWAPPTVVLLWPQVVSPVLRAAEGNMVMLKVLWKYGDGESDETGMMLLVCYLRPSSPSLPKKKESAELLNAG